uniref:Coiled-coil domain containing 17 n=1 Tax=Gopherus evgoodei TaxID=1825980 RepID=A0A8C4YSV9_9SAUR
EMAFEVPLAACEGEDIDGGTSVAPMATHTMLFALRGWGWAGGSGWGCSQLVRACPPWLREAPLDAGCQEPDSVLVPLRALHLAYLQGGGSDPAVLAQMYDLQVEATALETAAGRQEHKERKKSKSLPPLGLGIAERMQPRWAGRRSPPMLPPPVAPPLPPPPFPIQGCSCSAEGSPHLSLCLLSLPHRAGFVIFYDFLLGLDPTFSQVCLVAGLYRNGQKMGKPTPLPVAYCQMGQSPLYVVDGQRGNSAILSAKQPVPRVRPSTSIALVMELQASGGFDAYGQEIQRLASRGWAKIHLFDQLHQLISGRWKIPVRLLPVQPGLTTEQLNGTPQAGKTELYLRVVNARDADMQSMAEIDPGKATMYQYPPTVSRSPRVFDASTGLDSTLLSLEQEANTHPGGLVSSGWDP